MNDIEDVIDKLSEPERNDMEVLHEAGTMLGEYKAIFDAIQPLLFALSKKVYGDEDQTVPLDELINKSVEWIKEH